MLAPVRIKEQDCTICTSAAADGARFRPVLSAQLEALQQVIQAFGQACQMLTGYLRFIRTRRGLRRQIMDCH